MATILLGALVTDIRGSIGGSTIRNVGSTFVLSNKSRGASQNVIRSNKTLFSKRNIFQSWNLLSADERKGWGELSDLYPQLDKFGNLVVLGAYQFYTKFFIQQSVTGFGVYLPEDYSNNISSGAVPMFRINFTSQKVEIIFEGSPATTFILVQVYPVRNKNVKTNFNRRKFIFFKKVRLAEDIDITSAFLRRFGVIDGKTNYRAVIYFQNRLGVRSTPMELNNTYV